MVLVGHLFVLDKRKGEVISNFSFFKHYSPSLYLLGYDQKAGLRISKFPKRLSMLLLVSSHEEHFSSIITGILKAIT